MDIVEFEARFERRGDDDCWPWTGSSGGKGYGRFSHQGKSRLATHVALELDGRPRPSPRHCACHTCDNPPCVNPAHLWWGTVRENALDAASKGRLTLQTNPELSFFADPRSNEFRPRGSAHGMSKLDEAKVREIKRELARGTVQRRLATRFGVDNKTICLIAKGRTWRHV